MPILTFYLARDYCLGRNFTSPDMWAGGAAIVMTNVIIGIYCYSAYIEDLNDEVAQKKIKNNKNNNDDDQPRVGVWKQRTD
eukprot:CAMPEP_0198148332 /NCGR_PEP_ID=MMETSP1443-20131203/40884_1 /TAXON_ID=186043 /ORGANISM="Entomoneis sp., Strain CCMP2396" /LENGTH=80 /DNA_ID=CAMNT_0043812991 /DNA_START=204 /DNA_END=446 /DNA_ORIENTATION=-